LSIGPRKPGIPKRIFGLLGPVGGSMTLGQQLMIHLVVVGVMIPDALGQLTRAPTPTNYHPPTGVPTSVPTSKPSYGPSSMTVVEEIMGGVLGGILLLTITYFIIGYYSYVSEMENYEKLMDDKDKREEVNRRRESTPHGEMYNNDALSRASNQIDVSKEKGDEEEEEEDPEAQKTPSDEELEHRPLLQQQQQQQQHRSDGSWRDAEMP